MTDFVCRGCNKIVKLNVWLNLNNGFNYCSRCKDEIESTTVAEFEPAEKTVRGNENEEYR